VVSILIPVYNAAPHLRRCLDSALGQTLRDIEVVCVDDGSTDGSPAILAEYAARDPRLRVIFQKNNGTLHARSEAARIALGEYFLCLDADDCFRPSIVEQAVSVARRLGVDVVEFSASIRCHGIFQRRRRWRWGSPNLGRMGKILEQPALALEAVAGRISSLLWNKLVRREIFLAADGSIPPEVRIKNFLGHEDELFYILIFLHARSYTAIPAIGCDYTIWPTSISWQLQAFFPKHLATLDTLFLALRTLHQIVPPSLHPHLFDHYARIVFDYTDQWERFTPAQRLLAWQWIVDGFHFSSAAHAFLVGRIFGSKKILRQITANLLRRRPLSLFPGEWARNLLRFLFGKKD
jgi:glycosyltransferase involved in cell wall biosynthesis